MSSLPLRIIARLDIKAPNVIKGVHLEGLRVVGEPGTLSRKYYGQGIDEIVYMDVVATLYGRNNIQPIVREVARDVFVPLTVGGGIRTIDDITAVLRAGADKVAINTAGIGRPAFLREAAERFGSQCIVLSVEAIRRGPETWEAVTDNGRENTGRDVLKWVCEAERLGIGEILLTSVDAEGERKGFDIPLVKAVRERVGVPVIASGGAGAASHLIDLVNNTAVDAIACAALFHYDVLSVPQLKAALQDAGIGVRQ